MKVNKITNIGTWVGSLTAAAFFSENLYLAPLWTSVCRKQPWRALQARLTDSRFVHVGWITTYQGENCLRGSCSLQDPPRLNQLAYQNAFLIEWPDLLCIFFAKVMLLSNCPLLC